MTEPPSLSAARLVADGYTAFAVASVRGRRGASVGDSEVVNLERGLAHGLRRHRFKRDAARPARSRHPERARARVAPRRRGAAAASFFGRCATPSTKELRMSDHWLRIIPRDPLFRPSSAAMDQALSDALRRVIGSCDEIEVQRSDVPVYFDCGSKWEGVRCPVCHADLEATWGDLMDAWWVSGDLIQELRCCAHRVSLNDLEYKWPCGFARFAVSARNPDRIVTDAECEEINSLLGAEVRVVLHYL